ncbi:AraC family transcriptional regulator [Leptospira santarosai]|uniref:AraC family transcriptional regulator n=1 Tax=Leptospira santarosai TaxID=28183 RepID=UPI0007735087|nr:helix-turn-helix domain-containing protein [Leptospira santarosai]MDI7198426.1 helix-turn-helix domain-containing protein [Leptospira santarosai]MDI7205262.1 helix-turn-helix domain-containing protein [Leptospira santarosai]
MLQSCAFFLILNGGILFEQGTFRNENRITFGFYYGLVLYSCIAVLVCFHFILGNFDNPWIYCKRLLGMIPVVILFSYLIPDLFFISFIDFLGFGISTSTLFWSGRKIIKNNFPISYFNLPFLSFLISICFAFDLFGTVYDKKDFFLFAELIPGSIICYAILLERFFPSLFSKATIPNIDKDFVETIPKDIEKKKYPPRNILDGIDLNKVEIKLNHFLAEKGFKDEELRLPDFAAYLGITTHQASKYLNKYLSMSYVDFLNYHRINEVMDMIRIKSDYNLLNIALECGFNSASSFHRASIKFTGKSPRNLRKDILLNSESLKNVDPQNKKT